MFYLIFNFRETHALLKLGSYSEQVCFLSHCFAFSLWRAKIRSSLYPKSDKNGFNISRFQGFFGSTKCIYFGIDFIF